MPERVRSKRARLKKAESESKCVTLVSARWELFDQPEVIEGEDNAKYHELLDRIRAAVKPVDTIDDMFIADIASLEWEVLRWRRLKTSRIRALGLRALEDFLGPKLDYDLYSERFADRLTEVLEENFPGQADDVSALAQECARNEPNAIDKVGKLLASIGEYVTDILDGAQASKAKDIVQQYVRQKSDAVTLVNELLVQNGTTVDTLLVKALADELDFIERIDRLTAVAEGRRNGSLREIDRRRAVLGGSLRRTVQELETDEFELIDATPAEGKEVA